MDKVLVSQMNSVYQVTINKPDIHNAFDDLLIKELTDVFADLGKKKDCRIIVLTGAGPSFCAGGDLNWMKRMVHYSIEENLADSRDLAQMFLTIYNCPVPVVGKINGTAIGGGTGLVAVCDIAIASDQTMFAFSEVKIGLLPAVISPFVVEKIGQTAAKRYFLTGERFNVEVAKAIGLISEFCGDQDLEYRVKEVVKTILNNSPESVVETKNLIKNVSQGPTKEAVEYAVSAIAKIRITKNGQEGMNAFLNKRKPQWL